MTLVVFVDEVDHNFDHHVFLFGAALGNHQGQSNEGVVGNTFGAVGVVEDAVIVEKPQEQRGSNALVAVAERVVLSDQVEQHSGFLLDAGIEILAIKGLINLPDAALERVVLLVAKQCRAAKFGSQQVDLLHGILVCRMEHFVGVVLSMVSRS